MTVDELVAQAASLPFAGAARIIRRIDPFWQTDIGVERSWQGRFVEMNFEKCDCPNCDGCREVRGSVEDVIVEAVNAVEAAELANFEASDPWWEFQGVRLVGADATFAIPAA